MVLAERTGFCVVCGGSSSRVCDHCQSSSYCSRTCEDADSPAHGLLCRFLSEFDISSRPSKDHFRAILFPVDHDRPEVIWLYCKWRDPGAKETEKNTYKSTQIETYLGPYGNPRHEPVRYNVIEKTVLPNIATICYRSGFHVDTSNTNISVATIINTQKGQRYDWRGPIVAYSSSGQEAITATYKDFEFYDYRNVVDYFLSYDQPAPNNQKSYQGVRINCLGDQNTLSRPRFEAVDVPWYDPIFSHKDASDIANLVEFSVLTRRCIPHVWKSIEGASGDPVETENPLENWDAMFLHLCCDPDVEFDFEHGTGAMGWGYASSHWRYNTGSALVVRQDRKPLAPLHVEALCRYGRYHVQTLMSHSLGDYELEEPLRIGDVLSMIRRESFVTYWHKLLEERRMDGDVSSVPYPYDD